MVGRNFWAKPKGDSWIVQEEGLPDQGSSHDSRDDAWAAANERAAELKGEAFLTDEEGNVVERKWYGSLPRDITI